MKKLIQILAVGLIALSLGRAADTVELLPGKIAGSITFTSETIKNGTVYANATDGSSSAQSSFTGSDYSLVVPAGKTWRLYFYVYFEVPDGTGGYNYTYVNLPDEVSVAAEQTVTHDLPIASARIVSDVQVANGTLDKVTELRASGSSGTVSNFSFNYYSQNVDYVVSLPFANVSVYGSATVTSETGETSAQSLTSQTLNVPASGATATWNLDAAFASGAIVGDVAMEGALASNSSTMYLYNSTNTQVGTRTVQGTGPYEFTNLLPGRYRYYGYHYFDRAQLYMYGYADAVAGEITEVDYVYNLGLATAEINPTGFLTKEAVSSGNVYGQWTTPSPNPDGLSRTSYANFDPTARRFSGPVTPGEWKFSQLNLNGYDYTTPGVYISYALGIYDYQATPVTFTGGESQTVATFDFDTTQTELTFDVVESAGATSETLISNAQVSGYVTTYAGGSPQQQLSFSSSTSTSSPQPRQRVRIVGIPGTYNVQTYGYVDGSRVSFGTFSLELKEPLPTPVGTHVEVTAGTGVDLVFDHVVTAGVTTAAQLPVGPALPGGYTTIINNDVTAYYSISTTATFDGYIDVTIDYVEGAVAPEREADLKLFYFDDATQTWVDITIEVDEENNTITGTAPELALFAIGITNGPLLSTVTVPDLAEAGTEITISATFDDADQGESHTVTIEWGDGTVSAGSVNAATGEITATHTYDTGGTFTGTMTLVDATGNSIAQEFTVVVEGGDSLAPEITVTANATAEATGPDGAVVEFEVTATDDTDGDVTVETSVASGSVFPIGTTTVTATATDAAGNVATTTFDVVVADTTAPIIDALESLTLEATSAEGATATFAASAVDLVTENPTVESSVESGSVFPLGTTTVTLTTVDAAGNAATAEFSVTVVDTTAPEISAPADLVVEADNAEGAVVTFEATGSDGISGEVTVEASIASGSTFVVGTTPVTLTATDAAGNVSTRTFSVTVQDTTAPALSVPGDVVLEATSAAGATGTFTASATDSVSGELVVESSVASGSTFPMGTTVVNLSTTDAAGNAASGSFTVTVQDTTAPEIVSVSSSVDTLWPANHKMVDIAIAAVTSDAAGDVTVRVVAVSSNEPDNGAADGNTVNDAVITGDLSVSLRAERSGKGTGRIYTITLEATDSHGNVSSSFIEVGVPKSQGSKSEKSEKSAKSEKTDKSDKDKGKSAKSDSNKSSKSKSKKG